MSSIAPEASVPQSVLELVEMVGRLETDDQDRILRIVTLLAMASQGVQTRTQRMLRRLVASNPATASDCIEQIDELIDFLEENVGVLESLAGDARESSEGFRYN